MASEICSCGYPVLEYMRHTAAGSYTHASACARHTREKCSQQAAAGNAGDSERTLETGINVSLFGSIT